MSVCEEREEEEEEEEEEFFNTQIHRCLSEMIDSDDLSDEPSPGSSCVSMKSDRSMGIPPNLSDGPAVTSDPVVDHGGEFRITPGLHKYAVDLTLDPNTAHTYLALSEENRKVTCVYVSQSYPDHPERFDVYHQVLCGESLTGRCYWECEWSGGDVEISVSYKGIGRKGGSRDIRVLLPYICSEQDSNVFGRNEKSWSLFCSDDGLAVLHNSNRTAVSAGPGSCKRAGVFVDVSAGTLSFYSVSDTHTLTHLHTFTHTFTEPLYAGFTLNYVNSSVSLCHIKQHTHSD
ncbi:hypothetical protein R3I93_001351 [Phoxinus phoxinus]|uniref:B30.2/SPRY domain-containing protein n=1 Tax=Phoxinus phoxinus TaxID=58324 RepID=A0AAN9DI01_9TELE